jgi:hypothetical protein
LTVLGSYCERLALSPKQLETFRKLVNRQRRLEKQLVPLETLQDKEKATRDALDALLRLGGVEKGHAVLCNGYEVAHHERAGRTSINADKLRGAGVAELDIQFATDTGNPSTFATVKPAKGSKVRNG